MSPFDVDQLIILGGSDVPKLWELLVRMSAAVLLGAAISFRVWRVLLPFVGRPSMAHAQAQTLIAAAGAVMVVVIGAQLRTIFPTARIIDAGSNAPELGKDTGKLVFGLDLKHGEDARSLGDKLAQHGVSVRRVALSTPD